MGRLLMLIAVLTVSALSLFCGDDPMIGTWQLNVSRSHYYPGPIPKSQVRVYASSEEGTQETVTTVNADGETVKVIFPGIYDGRDYPVTGSSQYDTIALHRIDDHVAEASLKHAGNEILKARRVVSQDGKTMTITVKSADPRDPAVNITAIYDKQE